MFSRTAEYIQYTVRVTVESIQHSSAQQLFQTKKNTLCLKIFTAHSLAAHNKYCGSQHCCAEHDTYWAQHSAQQILRYSQHCYAEHNTYWAQHSAQQILLCWTQLILSTTQCTTNTAVQSALLCQTQHTAMLCTATEIEMAGHMWPVLTQWYISRCWVL